MHAYKKLCWRNKWYITGHLRTQFCSIRLKFNQNRIQHSLQMLETNLERQIKCTNYRTVHFQRGAPANLNLLMALQSPPPLHKLISSPFVPAGSMRWVNGRRAWHFQVRYTFFVAAIWEYRPGSPLIKPVDLCWREICMHFRVLSAWWWNIPVLGYQGNEGFAGHG